ncbi:chaperonin 10-like protein [Podospora didyma]|uniref:Chaperonin 10-like protein n=1 Tax=Podospora didyma TaxID=330526 RepID=A0AAE0P8J3_9PEZI|nr:chaperonin 10-like protein [Podospora didyma]
MAQQTSNIAALIPAPKADIVVQDLGQPSAPGAGEVLIRNHAIALNPIDWKRQSWGMFIESYPAVIGADVAGTVTEVGPDVTAFKKGDRVIGFANSFTGGNKYGAHQTFTLAQAFATAKIPASLSFAEAATVPTGVSTASMALFDVLGLPLPGTSSSPSTPSKSILIWGGASTVGFFTIQIARLAGLTVFAAASPKHHAKLRSLGATEVVDYRSPTAVEDLVAAAEKAGTPITLAFDTISTAETLTATAKVLSVSSGGKALSGTSFVHTTPWPETLAVVEGIKSEQVRGEQLWGRRKDLSAWLYNDALPKWLAQGGVIPSGHRTIPGGLSGIQEGLDQLKKGVSGEKLMVEI